MQASTPSFVLEIRRCRKVKLAGDGSGEWSFSVARCLGWSRRFQNSKFLNLYNQVSFCYRLRNCSPITFQQSAKTSNVKSLPLDNIYQVVLPWPVSDTTTRCTYCFTPLSFAAPIKRFIASLKSPHIMQLLLLHVVMLHSFSTYAASLLLHIQTEGQKPSGYEEWPL